MNTLLLASDNPQWGLGTDGRGFCIFGFEIYFYALCIVTAMLMAALFSAILMKRRNMAWDFIFTLFITCIPTAIIGARLFSCITDPALGLKRFFDFRDGGLSIIGGASSGVAMGLLVCKLKKVNFFRAADCVVPTIFLAHMFGRWGNFFNAEVYGGVVTDPAKHWFPLAVPIAPGESGVGGFSAPNPTWHYAFFFYEGMICLAVFCALFATLWYWKKKPNGLFTFSYFLIYGIIRTIMEPLRDASFQLGHKVPASMVMSILYIVFAVAGITTLLVLNYLKEGSVFGSKKGDPCGITEYLSPNKNEQPYYSKINMFGDQYPPKPPKEEREKVSVKEWFVQKKEWFSKLFHKNAEENTAPEEPSETSEEQPKTEDGEKGGDADKNQENKEE